MAFSTSTAARWTILSSSAGTPSGLCRVGIERRRCVGGQRGVAVTGSSSDYAGASFRASISFLRPPVSSRTAGFPRSGWGQQLSPWSLPMMTSHVKRWPASFSDHQVCSKARRARLHHQAPATVCRLVCVARPLLPRAPLLRRHYPPSLLLRAHAHVLWPPCPFDLGLVGAGLRRLCHSRLVHRTVLALTVWLRPKVSCPVRRVLARCIRSFSSQATSAFATDGWLGALQVPPQATSRGTKISALQAFSSITTLSFTCPPGRSHAVTRGEGFVARACLEFVSSSQVEPVIRLNRPITGAGSAPACHRVLLAAPVGLWYVHPTHRLRSVRSSLQPFGKILEISLQLLAVVSPRLSIHARRSFLLQREVGHAQRFQVVDVVQKRREPQLLILSCCLTYPLQRTRRVFPARCPGHVLLWQVPFGQTLSLHPLRDRLPGLVRGLLRYYWSVRLPRSVRHRRMSLDFPIASASRSECLSRLNTRPARSPVNASTPPLRAAPHDSGPMWVATSHSYDFCIHYTSPVLTGAQGEPPCQNKIKLSSVVCLKNFGTRAICRWQTSSFPPTTLTMILRRPILGGARRAKGRERPSTAPLSPTFN